MLEQSFEAPQGAVAHDRGQRKHPRAIVRRSTDDAIDEQPEVTPGAAGHEHVTVRRAPVLVEADHRREAVYGHVAAGVTDRSCQPVASVGRAQPLGAGDVAHVAPAHRVLLLPDDAADEAVQPRRFAIRPFVASHVHPLPARSAPIRSGEPT
jgi:hypothetical protein